jgi:hypothetical protein
MRNQGICLTFTAAVVGHGPRTVRFLIINYPVGTMPLASAGFYKLFMYIPLLNNDCPSSKTVA